MRLRSLNASKSKLFVCDLVTFNCKPFTCSFNSFQGAARAKKS